jgi:hypothetical protein
MHDKLDREPVSKYYPGRKTSEISVRIAGALFEIQTLLLLNTRLVCVLLNQLA